MERRSKKLEKSQGPLFRYFMCVCVLCVYVCVWASIYILSVHIMCVCVGLCKKCFVHACCCFAKNERYNCALIILFSIRVYDNIYAYRMLIEHCVFSISPSKSLGCYWLYKKLPANRSDCTLALR